MQLNKNERKDLVSSFYLMKNLQTMSRINAKKFFITLNEASLNYEFIKDIYKRAFVVYKSDSSKRTLDNNYIFQLSKQKSIDIMCKKIQI